MVLIDTVYQRVLAIANKEQRGYITPLEFNLMANQASLDVFEQYFYDKNQNERLPGNSTAYADVEHLLDEKIAAFAIEESMTFVGGGHNLPMDCYILGTVVFLDPVSGQRRICEEVSEKQRLRMISSPLTSPTNMRPVYTRFRSPGLTSGIESGIRVFGDGGAIINTPIICNYTKTPNKVEWGYDVVAEKALYNADPTRTVNFEHHPADETTLVMKILELAGIIIQDVGITQYGDQEDLKKNQLKKA
tara:strand:+ start:316 stop:1056 length:741 start_codon:yes stop_codon:yes gene_type:complete